MDTLIADVRHLILTEPDDTRFDCFGSVMNPLIAIARVRYSFEPPLQLVAKIMSDYPELPYNLLMPDVPLFLIKHAETLTAFNSLPTPNIDWTKIVNCKL